MIVTVTLNPAIDKTLIVPDFRSGIVNRVLRSREDAGGKGINVSKTIKSLGGDTLATGFLAGSNGRFIRDSLNSVGIRHDFTDVPGQVRTNIKIISENGAHTDINEPGFNVSDDDFERLYNHVLSHISRHDICVISGRTPPNLSIELYRKLCTAVRDTGARLIVDADGERLRTAVSIHPTLIKPNLAELSALSDKPITNAEDAAAFAKELVDEGVGAVMVTMGADGAVYVDGSDAWRLIPPKVEVRGPVGAGDSAVGGIAMAMSENMEPETLARFATAAGTASTTIEGMSCPSRREVLRIFEHVTVSKY